LKDQNQETPAGIHAQKAKKIVSYANLKQKDEEEEQTASINSENEKSPKNGYKLPDDD